MRFSPLRQQQTRKLTLHTVVGAIRFAVDYGRDRPAGKWVCPARARRGLGPHPKMTPELEDRVCLTATLAGSYQAAAQLAAKWGSPVEASTIRAHACQVGQRAAAQAQERLRVPASPVPGERVAWHEIKGAVIYRLEQAGQTGVTRRNQLQPDRHFRLNHRYAP